MKSRTPLSDLVGGAQNYLKLEAKALRLKVFITATDTAFRSLRLGVAGILLFIAALFLGAAFALWLGAILSPAAGFAITGLLFAVFAAVGWRVMSQREASTKDKLLSLLSGEASRLEDMQAQLAQMNDESARLSVELEAQLLTLRETAGRIERLINPDENLSAKSIAGNLARSAAGAVIRHALLPKVGTVGKVVAPVLAGALLRSAPVGKLVKKVRSVFRRK